MDTSTRISFHLCCLLLLLMSHFGICIKCIPSEHEALLRFKLHLNDSSNRLSSWNVSNPNCCHWYGVLCSQVTGHVLQLDLHTSVPHEDDFFSPVEYEEAQKAYANSLFRGEISHYLVELKHLKYLDLSGNYFRGMQIPTFLCEITTLVYLNLSYSGFHWKIPYQIGNLSNNLLYLDLKGVAYGPIPYQIGNLTNLIHLDLKSDYEERVGENLDWLSTLSSLEYLNLEGADLSNSFGWLQTMQALPSLVELNLARCDLSYYKKPLSLNFSSLISLTITISPNWIFQLNKLTSLIILSYNSNKPFPKGIQNLTLLENLDLSYNLYSPSSIPNWLYALHHLKFLNLRDNNLCGPISHAVGNLTSLVSLDLSHNQLEGRIPASLGNLTSLVSLDLSFNIQLEGGIPNSFENLCKLRDLAFSFLRCNQLVSEILQILSPCISHELRRLEARTSLISGNLTDQLGMFHSLVILDFAYNSIVGTLPRSLGQLLSLTDLSLSNNQLNGNPFRVLRSIPKLSSLGIEHNLFQGIVQEIDLVNLTALQFLDASGNDFTLQVGPNWQPVFQLINLDMRSWKLGPNFPSWIKSQKNLRYLDMSDTGISTSIPNWFWQEFSHDGWYLNLSSNSIHGHLPNSLETFHLPNSIETFQSSGIMLDLSSNHLQGRLPSLPADMEWLDLSNNLFFGSMTDFLCQKHDDDEPSRLQFLNLGSNNLSGKIPDCWKRWPNLVDMNLQNNYLIGNLPTSMAFLSKLQSLHLRNNMLSGEFPLILSNISYLVSLDIGENTFNGSIPLWVGERLPNLKILRLRSNQFLGHIPNGICDMKFLQDLDLAQNHLSGTVPKCFDHLSAMVINERNQDSFIRNGIISVLVWVKGVGVEYRNNLGLVKNIDLSGNNLSGKLPPEITRLSELIFLNLSRNLLTGNIPGSIGNMRALESIDLSRNQLYGDIPSSITNLSFLSKLDLSHNQLKGHIPTGTQLQTFEASSFIGNDLCGPPLTINCSSNGKVPDVEENGRESNGHGINWFFVSMGLGFIVGFWGVVAPLFIYRSWRFAYFRFLDNI
ncbi:hypothetical protein PIB30_048452, partial [Stylosanthes scabra]|nr:hypothetical protein [Stylosanthes scabra]